MNKQLNNNSLEVSQFTWTQTAGLVNPGSETMPGSLDAQLNNPSRIKLSYVTVHCCRDVNKEQTAQDGVSLRMYHLHPPTDNSGSCSWKGRRLSPPLSPGGTGTVCCRSLFLLRIFLPPFPQLLLPILRGELDPPLTSVVLGWRREVGSILQMPMELGEGTLLRHPGGRETWFPTVQGGVRLRTPPPPGVHEDWWLYPVLSSLRQTSQEWQLVLPGLL